MDDFEYVTPQTIKDKDSIIDYQYAMDTICEIYEDLVMRGVPEEDARYVLPNACCTNITVTMNARELRHFFEERLCERAQWEIHDLAVQMLREVQKVAPALFEGAGAKCIRLGYCPEAKGCGRMPKLDDLHSAYWKSLPGDGKPKEEEEK